MKYIVAEVQVTDANAVAAPTYVYDTEREALAKYHQILSAAAISGLKKHGAIIFTDEELTLYSYCFVDLENSESPH